MIHFNRFDSPLGTLLATAEDGVLTGLYFSEQKYHPATTIGWIEDGEAQPFPIVRRQLDEYFAGRRRVFDFPMRPGGCRATSFQQAIWDAIAAVPYGATTTYAQLAAACGRPSAARAAGAATGRNPISVVIPCHRIVGGSGALTGYAGGLPRKRALLGFERSIAEGRAGALNQLSPDDLFAAVEANAAPAAMAAPG